MKHLSWDSAFPVSSFAERLNIIVLLNPQVYTTVNTEACETNTTIPMISSSYEALYVHTQTSISSASEQELYIP